MTNIDSIMQKPLRVLFMGSADFAVPALEVLCQNALFFEVLAVYTQPPRKKGRGQKLLKTPIHEVADAHGLSVYSPLSLKNQGEEEARIKAMNLDFIIVVAYGLILPQAILDLAQFGAINIHGSLLPRWRGAAPIQRAIEAGDFLSGVTFIQMDAGLDTGDILQSESCEIMQEDTSPSLGKRLAEMGANALPSLLTKLAEHKIMPLVQDHANATYAAKLSKQESIIDWQESAYNYDLRYRAFNPWPGLSFNLKDEEIKLKQIAVLDNDHREKIKMSKVGMVINLSPLQIACKEGALSLISLQRPSRPPISGEAFAHAIGLKIGDSL